MTNAADRRPFSMPYVNHVTNVVANTATMIARAPWPQPVGKYFVLRKLVATYTGLTSGGVSLAVWDQDLSNTTPIARGSAGGPLLVIPATQVGSTAGQASGISIPSMTILDIDACPQEMFQAGICIQSFASGLTVSFEADVI